MFSYPNFLYNISVMFLECDLLIMLFAVLWIVLTWLSLDINFLQPVTIFV